MRLRQGWLLGLLLLTGSAHAAELALDACTQKQVNQEVLQAAVAAEVQRMSGDSVKLSMSAMGAWPVLDQPRVVLLSKALRSRMAATITGKSCDSNRQIVETVWFKVKALREGWVYGRNARQDSPVSEAAPHREAIDIAALQLASSELAGSLEDQWLRQAVYAGHPALKQQLKSESLVRRDQQVAVVVRGPGLELRAQGKALQSGILGDRIQVLVSGAEASMPATVAGKGEVYVDVEM